jgi:hypothetical protein
MQVELSAGLLLIPMAEVFNKCKDLNIYIRVFSRWTKSVTISENIVLTGDVSIMFF